jgi:riboflavin biosynthesis pyrimidine reductase
MSELEPLALLHRADVEELALPGELRRLYGGDLELPERCLYSNFVETIDGVVAIPSLPGSNGLISGGSEADRFVMGMLRAAADLVLIGSGTLRASPGGRWRPQTAYSPAAEAYAALRRELGYESYSRVAIVTASGSIPTGHPVLADGPIVLTTERGAARLDGKLPAAAEIAVLPGETAVDVRAAVELLHERGHRRILGEAGPHVFGSLVEADLVDDLFLTVSPLLAGTLTPALGLVEGVSLLTGRARAARLGSVRKHGSHLFLHYALRPEATPAT